jgi:molecular chaperone GrpE
MADDPRHGSGVHDASEPTRKGAEAHATPDPEDGRPQQTAPAPPPDAAAGSPPDAAPAPPPDTAAGSPPDAAPAPPPEVEKEEGEPAADVAEEADHEAQLEHDLEELAAKAGKADEYLELAQRTKADFENYRRRATKEAAAAQERGIVKLALELLPTVDDLDRALQATDGSGEHETLVSGVKLVHAGVLAALARCGIEPYSPDGERFDPQHHEAVAQHPVDGVEPGTVVEVYQCGYRLGDSILRPARVVVAG